MFFLSGSRWLFLSATLELVDLALRWHPRFAFVARLVWFACVCAGIRVLLACFRRRPCAGRHLLFFADAKKSRQKKAAHTASPCSYPRAPNVPTLRTTVPWLMLVANASNERLTRFEYPYSGHWQRMVC